VGVGTSVGFAVEVGEVVGCWVGVGVGTSVGFAVEVGEVVGCWVGVGVGTSVGFAVGGGVPVGSWVGVGVGTSVGFAVEGCVAVGVAVGAAHQATLLLLELVCSGGLLNSLKVLQVFREELGLKGHTQGLEIVSSLRAAFTQSSNNSYQEF
jgi:hypothetical protein